MDNNSIYDHLLKQNGLINQNTVAIEELSELIKEITKINRSKGNNANLAEEIADVEIVIEQLKRNYVLLNKVEMYKEYKLKRLALSIEEQEDYK